MAEKKEYVEKETLINIMLNGLFPDKKIENPFDVLRAIKHAPTADVAEVVRCKDCKYRDELCMCCHPRHEGILPLAYPLDFCSYGERRTDNDIM